MKKKLFWLIRELDIEDYIESNLEEDTDSIEASAFLYIDGNMPHGPGNSGYD